MMPVSRDWSDREVSIFDEERTCLCLSFRSRYQISTRF
jgi:hypothetical protein